MSYRGPYEAISLIMMISEHWQPLWSLFPHVLCPIEILTGAQPWQCLCSREMNKFVE